MNKNTLELLFGRTIDYLLLNYWTIDYLAEWSEFI